MRLMFSIVSLVVLSACSLSGPEDDRMEKQRFLMVEQQIRSRGVGDERVLQAMEKVKRHLFIPENNRDLAYQDFPVSIGFGQTISQPYIVAYMTEVLGLKSGEKVLEIGTGSGYQAAILAELVGAVYTIEIIPELAAQARKTISELGYTNVHVRQGDGFKGWPEAAPFDAIMVTAAPDTLPEKLVEQLRIGGRMVIPVGSFYQELYLITRTARGFDQRALLPVRFVPMVRDHEP